jgi:hypothetical protein
MTRLEKSRVITEIVKSLAEIIALIIAGLWALSNFQEAEKPSLESRANTESLMQWFHSPDQNHCLGSLGVKIKNIGKKSINLDRAVLSVWVIDQPTYEKEITYLDPEQFHTEKAVYEKNFVAGQDKLGLLGHFPPDTEGQTDFTFDFEKQAFKIAFFSFMAYGPDLQIHERRWSYICDLPT